MAKLKSRIIDRNRFVKKYPLIRAPKRNTFVGDSDLQIELFSVEFSNESERTLFFDATQKDENYRVLLSARDTTDSDSAQVTLSVDDNASDLTRVTILSSAAFTGLVDVIVIRVG